MSLETMTIVRNTDKPLSYIEKKILRGDNEGETYLAPKITKENFISEVVPHYGLDVIVSIVEKWGNQKGQQWSSEAKNAIDGSFDTKRFETFAIELSARGESRPDLIKEQEELAVELKQLPAKVEAGEITQEEADLQRSQKVSRIVAIADALSERKRAKKDEAAPVAA